jgi:Ca-activated chloride channel homolog
MRRTGFFITMMLLASLCSQVYAGGLYARRPGTEQPVYNLVLSKISSTVNIYGQLAVTHVDEEFFNDNNLTLEGFYVFQLPEGATVNGLWLWIDGQRRKFAVLKKEDAERIYDSIVNPTQPPRDPAILESLGANRFQLKVFPIPPHSSRRVELKYFHTLPLTLDGNIHYRYPLNMSAYQSVPVQETNMRINVHSYQRIQKLTTNFDGLPLLNRVDRVDEFNYSIGFGLENTNYTNDYILSYEPENIYTVFPTLAWQDPNDDNVDPYFMTWHPVKDETVDLKDRDIVFVLDASGSMSGKRINDVRTAINGLLPKLREGDRFRIVLFSSNAVSFPAGNGMLNGTTENIEDAIQYINTVYIDGGSTNYEAAFISALSPDFRTDVNKKMVFLTDGDPTSGARTYEQLISVIQNNDPAFVSIYPVLFYTGKIQLLYDIAQARGGTTHQVEDGDNLQTIIERILFDLDLVGYREVSVSYLNGQTYHVFPKDFAKIAVTTQLVTTGRFTGNGQETAELRYKAGDGTERNIPRDVNFLSTLIDLSEVAAYWASKRMDELLNEIKIHGETPELIESIISLSIRHSILSPYTAFLVVETSEIDPPTNTESLGSIADRFELSQNYPNPFSLATSAITTIPFTVARGADVRIVITDMLGRVVKIVREGFLMPGTYKVTWDGTNKYGQRVAPGTYILRMQSGQVASVKIISVVR